MIFPITEEDLQNLAVRIEKKEGRPLSENRKKRAILISYLVNKAYKQGYMDGCAAEKGDCT